MDKIMGQIIRVIQLIFSQMRHKFSVKFSLTLLLVLVCFVPGTFGQFAVFDAATYGQTLKGVFQTMRVVSETAKTAREVKNTYNEIQKLYRMQEDIRKRLKNLRGIKDLKFRDFEWLIFNADRFLEDPSRYVRRLPYGREFSRIYGQMGRSVRIAEDIYEKISGVGGEVPRHEVAKNRLALEEIAMQRKVEIARQYKQSAIKLQEYAVELQEAISLEGENALEMSEAERLQALAECHDMFLEALALEKEADKLLLEVSEGKSAIRTEYQARQRRKAVRKTLVTSGQFRTMWAK